MADNVAITAGAGTSIATDQVGADHYQLIKLAFGPLDTATLVTAAAGLPVAVVGTVPVSGTFWQATQPVSGTVAISGTVAVASVGGAVEVANDAGNPIPVSGTVTANIGTAGTLALESGGNLAAIAGKDFATQTTLSALNAKVTACNTGAVVVSAALPAGTNLVGVAVAPHQTGALYSGTTALTPKFAAIAASGSGDNTVVAAVASKKIRVLRYSLSSNGSVNAKFRSSTTSDLTGLEYLTQFARGGGAYCPLGLFETVAGEALTLNLSAAVAVGGVLTYVEV